MNMHNRSPSELSWQEVGLPAEILPAAKAAYRDPLRAKRWIEILDRAPLRPVKGEGLQPLWRNESFLRELASAELDPDEFLRWREAGSEAAAVPMSTAAEN
jgi:hypothetical protein